MYGGDLPAALGAIRTPVQAMPSESDLYFPVEDSARRWRTFAMFVPANPLHLGTSCRQPADASA